MNHDAVTQAEVTDIANHYRRALQDVTCCAGHAGDIAQIVLVGFLLDINGGDQNKAAQHMERLSVHVAKSLRGGEYRQQRGDQG